MRKKVYFGISILLTAIMVLTIGFVNAGNSGEYITEIIDDGNTHLSSNGQTQMTKKIVEDNGTNLLYEVEVKNLMQVTGTKEVTLLIDTSKSMDINDTLGEAKAKAKEIVETLYDNVPGVIISIVDNNGIKINRYDVNGKQQVITTIEGLSNQYGNSIDETILTTKSTFSATNVQNNKYLIVLTDATDTMQEIQNIQDPNIETLSILMNMTRESYQVDGVSTIGQVSMIDEFSTENLIAMINKAINNINIADEFSDEILKYYDFTVENLEDVENIGSITKTDVGYTWGINSLTANSIAKLQFRLTLKDNVTINENDTYKDINTSKNTKVTYNKGATQVDYDITDSPIILLCKKYSVTVKAVSEENKALPVEEMNVIVNVEKEDGTKIINNQTFVTDSDGNIIIDNLKTMGDLTFSIAPQVVNQVGYAPTDSTAFVIYNEATGNNLFMKTTGIDNTIDNDRRNVEVKIPINTKRFTLDVDLSEENNNGKKIGNTEFRLIQPKINNRYELSALYATTNSSGMATFAPTMMTKAGTYEYILSQTTETTDYESMGNVTLQITFDDNGQIENIKAKHNKKVTAEKINESRVLVHATNVNKNTDVFNFKLELSDSVNNNYKIEGAMYDIEVKNSEGEITTYTNQKTDSNGNINLTIQGSGYIQIKVTEVLPKLGYYQDKVVKEIIVCRQDGSVQFIASKKPIELDVIADTANNTVQLNLTSEMNANPSAVQIKVADIMENDVQIEGVKLKLIGTMTNEEYEGVTDAEGNAMFLIQPQDEGIYQYKIVIDNETLPKGYSEITGDILVNIGFNEDKQIDDASDISGPIFEVDTKEYVTDDFVYNTAYFGIGVDISEEDSYNFQVKLRDQDNGKPLDGAKYNITIDNGTTVRNVTGRMTDKDGNLITRLMPAEELTITVAQTKSKIGYIIDENVQIIKLKKTDGIYKIVEQDPYEYLDNKNGAVIEDNNIVFYHTNVNKNNDSVLLNLYVNKMDEEDNLIGYLPLRVYSDTLRNADGGQLNEKVTTDENGYLEIEKIKVTNIEIPKDSEHILYIVETDEDGNDIASSKLKMKLTFRYNENKQIVEITNAESTEGNRLLKAKTFNGYETDTAYESNIYLDVYGKYEDVGNFALDLRKVNIDGELLNGAKYDITITRPDGTKLIRKDIEINDRVEFSGLYVAKGTIIEITEVEAPLGYKVNGYTETIRIDEISDDGTVSIDLDGTSDKIELYNTEEIALDDGTTKTVITMNVIDESLNTFKFGITTKDLSTLNGVAGFGYYFYTSKGAQVESGLTNGEGKLRTLVGGNYSNETVTYTIREIQTAKYYKKLDNPITLNIVFAEDGSIDSLATLASQTDENFGITWNILATNTEDGNDIDIDILNEPQDPLNVKLHTIDKVTGQELDNIEYKITPSVNLEATGTTELQVGYVAPGSIQAYQLEQNKNVENYQNVTKEGFTLTYDDNGEIALEPTNVSRNLEFVSKEGKTVEFKVYIEPKVPFVINAIGYFDNTPLEGTEYTLSQRGESTDKKTNLEGKATLYNGILGTDSEVTYTITENKVTQGYVRIDPFEIKVHYNSNREIDNVALVGEANRWIDVSYKQPSESTDIGYNGNDKGIVNITLKHYPEFLINITNQDRLEKDKKLSGALYSVESTIGTKDENVLTTENGLGVARLDKTLIDDKVVYTIHENRPASLYQTIRNDVKVEVIFDENGYVKSTQVIDGQDFAKSSKIENITDPRENFEINVIIENCKMLKFNITAVDSMDETYALRGLTFEVKSSLNGEQLSTTTAQTDINGQVTLGIDKDYANETITYTIKETGKLSGYQFPAEDLVIEVTFDSDGKMIPDSVKIIQGTSYTELLDKDADTFDIDLKIVNDETEDFGMHIISEDKYDSSIKIENVDYEAYLITPDYAKDENYTGRDTTNIHGEAYIQFGKYISSNPNVDETRTVIIKETNLSDQYRPIRAELAVNVTFDPNGIVKEISVPGGYNTRIGWIADGRFVSVLPRRHTIEVTIKHYPYLFMNVKAEDMYTGDALAGKYTISTHYGPGTSYIDVSKIPMQNKIAEVQKNIELSENRGATLEDLVTALGKDTYFDRITVAPDNTFATFYVGTTTYTVNMILEVTKAQSSYSVGGTTGLTNIDYIGYGQGEILSNEYTTTDDGEWSKAGVGPTEMGPTSREYYIYEQEAPSSPMQYQQYRPRYLSWEYSKIIAKITVTYDDKGRLQTYSIDEQRSNNNIKEFLEVKILDGTNLGITIKYAPITTMNVTTLDSVSRAPLSNIRVSPYINTEYSTRQSYEYRTIGYYTTNKDGNADYTYWGANINEGQNDYWIDTSLMGYQGYFGSGLVKIHVAYDNYGRISGADVMSTDENGVANAEIVGWEDNNLNINILYNRKFNLKIDKQDKYDENTKLSAEFNVRSDAGANTIMKSASLETVGMVRPGERVRYSLSETEVPNGYFPLENIEFYVTFSKNGTVKKVECDDKLFSVLEKREIVDIIRASKEQDLKVAIKNEPQFIIKLDVMDRYYNEKKLENVTFTMESSKGEKATGNPMTDKNGMISVPVGKVYKNETVTYTITQTSNVNGYYDNANDTIVVEVEYNEQGKIHNYRVKSGNSSVRMDETLYKNQRYIKLEHIGNKPKELQIGIQNKDKLTGEAISGVTYNVKAQEIVGGSTVSDKDFIINEDGTVVETINRFKETPQTQRIVEYTISQITIPDSYRKIQDVVIQVRFNEDGSMLSRNIISNPSNVKVDVALGGKLQYITQTVGNQTQTIPVHIKLTIENDNAYDIVIKDEDKNFTDLGVLGTIYDISINGEKIEGTTNDSGIIEILNRTESGTINIQIAEKEAGQPYRSNIENNTTIQVEKGTQDYSLDLISNSNEAKATVEVNEEYGLISIKFFNETKTTLRLIKDRSEVKYDITEEELENNELINARKIDIETADSPDKDELFYDLGVAPQNKIRVYTFKEISAPEDYNKVGTFKATVQYDMYGRISSIDTDSDKIVTIESPEKSNDIITLASEGEEVDNSYTIKVASEEVDSNLRINESIFDIGIRSEDGEIIQKLEGVQTGNIEKKGFVLEKGAIVSDKIKKGGIINIDIDQTKPADGNKFGDQITSGTVKAEINYNSTDEPIIEILEEAGFEVQVKNRQIIIKVKNEAEANMKINNVVKTKDEDGNTIKEPVEDSKFVITSQIQTKTDITDTDLNVTTAKTDTEGNTTAKVGTPYTGKTVLYTIHQKENEHYEPIEDIIVLVQYDTKGLIKYYEIISNPDNAQVIGEKGTRNIEVQIINEIKSQRHGYKVILEKHHIDDGEYEELIPGAKFKMEVEQEYGEYYTTWKAVTDEEGRITSTLFDGYGNITIRATEINPPEGFIAREKIVELRLVRDRATGKLREVDSNVNYTFSEDGSEIYVKPVNEPKEQYYTIMLNKMDSKTGKMITQSTAEFDVKMIEEENIGTEEEPEIEEVETYLGKFKTDNKGKAKIENMFKPEKAGTYKYIITETKSPEGYSKSEEPVVLEIDFVENDEGKIKMGDTRIVSGSASIKSKKNDLLNVRINNVNENDVGKYTLDITKKDAETNEPIENMAIFKVALPDENNTSVYTETMENDYGLGKLDYCYIEQDKDYDVRLTRMDIPKEEGTHVYTFKEIVAPEGYIKLDEDVSLTVEFRKNDSGKMYIANMTSSNNKYLRINTLTPCTTDTVISVDILNNAVSYTVEYNANDNGEGTVVPEKQFKGENIDLTLNTMQPQRDGYIFKGWATNANATDVEYQPGDVYTKNEDITLYAIWQKSSYSIEYKANDNEEGTIVPETQEKILDEDIKLDEMILSRDKYIFKGWATTEDATEVEYKPGDIYSENEDVILYAVWEEELYLKSSEYLIGEAPEGYKIGIETEYKEGDKYISRILPGTNMYYTDRVTAKMFMSNIHTNADLIEILDKENAIGEDDKVGTGMTLQLTKGEQNITITLAVTGDLNGDGIILVNDVTIIKEKLISNDATELEILAGDVSCDGKLRINDITSLRQILAGVIVDSKTREKADFKNLFDIYKK